MFHITQLYTRGINLRDILNIFSSHHKTIDFLIERRGEPSSCLCYCVWKYHQFRERQRKLKSCAEYFPLFRTRYRYYSHCPLNYLSFSPICFFFGHWFISSGFFLFKVLCCSLLFCFLLDFSGFQTPFSLICEFFHLGIFYWRKNNSKLGSF